MVENKMGYKPIGRLLIEVSFPLMISMFIQALYNIVDSYFVMQYSEDAFTAVSLAFPLQNIMIGVAVGTGVGLNALLSRSLGEKNYSLVNKSAENGLFLSLIYSILFALFGIFLSRFYFEVQINDKNIINLGEAYVRTVTIFSFGVFIQIFMERILQSTGKSLLTMVTQGIGAIINIILDPILIFGRYGMPNMGITGAAAATVIGQTIGMTIGIFLHHKFNKEVRIKGIRPDKKVIFKIYQVGFPSIILTTLFSLSISIYNRILNTFSSTAVSALGAYFKLQSFIFMPIFGLNNGMVPIVAYNYGARKKERCIKTFKIALFTGLLIMLIGMLIFQFYSGFILKDIYKVSDNLYKVAVPALKTISFCFLFVGYNIIIGSLFQALGNGILTMFGVFVRQFLGLLPTAYLLSRTGVLENVWWSFIIAEFLGVIYFSYFLKKFALPKINNLEA